MTKNWDKSSSGKKYSLSTKVFVLSYFSYYLAFSILSIYGGSRLLDRSLFIFLLLTEIFGTLHYYILINQQQSMISNHVKKIANSLVLFLSLILVYATIEAAIGDYEKVIALLPSIIGTCLAIPATFFYFHNLKQVDVARLFFWFLFAISTFSFASKLLGNTSTHLNLDAAFRIGNNIGYSFVLLTPLAIFAYKDRKWVGLSLVLLLSIFVFFSAKRGAIVTQAAVLLVILIKNPYKFGRYSYLIALCFAFLAIEPIMSYTNQLEFSPLERFRAAGGSGRDVIYSHIFSGIMDSSIKELFFGHGFYATTNLTAQIYGTHLAQAAHNDWLEIMYDFGLIGIITYACIPIYLLKNIYSLKNKFKFEARVLLLLFVIFMVKTNLSMIFADKDSIIYYITMALVLLEANLSDARPLSRIK